MAEQPFLYPRELFDAEIPAGPRPWVCVRTKSRREKKLSQWLAGRRLPHFLPVAPRITISHRRRREFAWPLFPGYVFVAQPVEKADFKTTADVVNVLTPTGLDQTERLDRDLWKIWRGLLSGSPLELARQLVPGDDVEVVTGALKGLVGRFHRWSHGGSLVLWVEFLGVGAQLEVPDTCVVRPV